MSDAETALPLALRECAARGVSADTLFAFQFTLGPVSCAGVSGLILKPFGDRILSHSRRLDVAALRDSAGVEIGYCLGVAVDAAGERLRDRVLGDVTAGTQDFWPRIEAFVIGLAGRYLLLLRDGREARIYGDVSSSYPCVYDPQTGQVGSTLLMALPRDIVESETVDYHLALAGTQRMPFGHTRDRFARRLAANHYLCLPDMSEHRFWPRPGDVADTDNTDAEIAAIRTRLARIIAGITSSDRAALPLSGGNDSRSLLACAKPVRHQIARYFTQTHNRNSRVDYRSAQGLARVFGIALEHHKLETAFTSDALAERTGVFSLTTGYGVPLPHTYNTNFWDDLGRDEIVMVGNVMEVLRAAHWRTDDINHRKLNRKFGLKRCLFVGGSDFTGDFVARWLPDYNAWYEGLPRDAQRKYIDFGFLEQYLPNFGLAACGYRDNFYLAPFNDRYLYARSAGLPLDYRYSNQANTDLLALAAPELAEVPFAWEIHSGKAA
jgi:hypothetical protein